jgi:hypothetical protein
MFSASDGYLYLCDVSEDDFVSIIRTHLARRAVERIWCGTLRDNASSSWRDSTCVVVKQTVYLVGLHKHEYGLVGCSLDISQKEVSDIPILRDSRLHRLYCDHFELIYLLGCLFCLAHCEDTIEGDLCRTKVLMWRLVAGSSAWEELPPVPTTRTSFSVTTFGQKLCVVGGESVNSAGVLGTVELFDPMTCSWEFLPEMPTSRSNPACGVRGGKLYVIGGSGDCYSMENEWPDRVVECYDPISKRWAQLPLMQTTGSSSTQFSCRL